MIKARCICSTKILYQREIRGRNSVKRFFRWAVMKQVKKFLSRCVRMGKSIMKTKQSFLREGRNEGRKGGREDRRRRSKKKERRRKGGRKEAKKIRKNRE